MENKNGVKLTHMHYFEALVFRRYLVITGTVDVSTTVTQRLPVQVKQQLSAVAEKDSSKTLMTATNA